MSNQIYGSEASIKKVQEIASVIKGTKPFVKELPLSTPSIKGQRKTKQSTLEKFLKSEGGFNWGLWRYPSVVQVPEATAKKYQAQMIAQGDIEFAESMKDGFLNNGYWYGRWDGDHRKHIWEATFPNDPITECMVYPVNTVEIANELFVKIQKFNQKGLTPEDTLVNQYYAKDPDALKIADFLEYCGLAIKNSEEGIVPASANTTTPSTRYRLFERSVKDAGLEETKLASDIIIAGMKMKEGAPWNNEIAPTFMYGTALLFKKRPLAMKNGLHKRLTQYIHDTMKPMGFKQKEMITLWARAGGDRHNYEAECFAYGLAKSFRSAVVGGSYGGNVGMCSSLELSTLEEDLGLKKD
jgi:hypothetical protein